MPITPNDRPLVTVREETIDTLVANYGRGMLSLEAFDRRLDIALAAETGDALVELTADLSVTPDVAEMRQQQARLGWQSSAPAAVATDVQRIVHIFGGGKRTGNWTVAPEIRLICLFGGTEVDFSAASFSAPVTRIRMLCLFGGAQFTVNEHTNVVNNLVCMFGGVEDLSSGQKRPDAPTILLEGVLLFGGAGIRVRKALKQRWLEFANHVKNALGT